MPKRFYRRAIFLILIISQLQARGGESKDGKGVKQHYHIEPLSYEEVKAKAPTDVRKHCSFRLLNSYSLYGDAASLEAPNPICPNLKGNCCGPQDFEKIPELWKYDQKRIQAYNMTYLRTLRYIMGYSKEYYKLAKQILKAYKEKNQGDLWGRIDKKNDGQKNESGLNLKMGDETFKDCYEAALDLSHINYDVLPKIDQVYDRLNHRARFLHTLRHNFYCMMCSPRGLKGIIKFSWYSNWTKKLKFPEKLCKEFTDNTLDITVEMHQNYHRFLSKALKLSMCIDFKDNKFNTKSEKFKKLTNDPLGFKASNKSREIKSCRKTSGKKFSMYACEDYCNAFNIAKPTIPFDGDMPRILQVYEYLEQLEPFMEYPESNLFKDDIAKLKTSIEENRHHVEDRFFKTVNHKVDLAEFKSEFTGNNNINPFEVGDGNKLHFKYKSAKVVSVLASVYLFLISI